MKTSEADRTRNRAFRTRLRQAIKDVRTETNREKAVLKLKTAMSIIDKAAGYHLIHRCTAARNKSRLTQFVNKLG